MLTKEIEIPEELFRVAKDEYDVKWTSNKVTIKRFLTGEIKRIESDSMKVNAIVGANGATTAKVDLDQSKNFVLTVARGVASSPWGANDSNAVEGLPPHISEWVYNEIAEFNKITDKKKETSIKQSEVGIAVTVK